MFFWLDSRLRGNDDLFIVVSFTDAILISLLHHRWAYATVIID
jgi:hypothetical protein